MNKMNQSYYIIDFWDFYYIITVIIVILTTFVIFMKHLFLTNEDNI